MYKITLDDGSTVDNLELNGNNFIAQGEVSDDTFEGKLSEVKILDKSTNTEETYTDMVLLSNIVRDRRSWIVLGEKTEAQKERERVEDNFTDIELAIAEVYEMIIGG